VDSCEEWINRWRELVHKSQCLKSKITQYYWNKLYKTAGFTIWPWHIEGVCWNQFLHIRIPVIDVCSRTYRCSRINKKDAFSNSIHVHSYRNRNYSGGTRSVIVRWAWGQPFLKWNDKLSKLQAWKYIRCIHFLPRLWHRICTVNEGFQTIQRCTSIYLAICVRWMGRCKIINYEAFKRRGERSNIGVYITTALVPNPTEKILEWVLIDIARLKELNDFFLRQVKPNASQSYKLRIQKVHADYLFQKLYMYDACLSYVPRWITGDLNLFGSLFIVGDAVVRLGTFLQGHNLASPHLRPRYPRILQVHNH